MYEFQLPSGRNIRLSALHIWPTYEGVLAGGLAERHVKRRIDEAADALKPVWGERPTYVLPPQIEILEPNRYGSRFRLPPYRYHAWLRSSPLDPEAVLSELVLVFFEKETSAPYELVAEKARDIPWQQIAHDFMF